MAIDDEMRETHLGPFPLRMSDFTHREHHRRRPGSVADRMAVVGDPIPVDQSERDMREDVLRLDITLDVP